MTLSARLKQTPAKPREAEPRIQSQHHPENQQGQNVQIVLGDRRVDPVTPHPLEAHREWVCLVLFFGPGFVDGVLLLRIEGSIVVR